MWKIKRVSACVFVPIGDYTSFLTFACIPFTEKIDHRKDFLIGCQLSQKVLPITAF